MASAPSSKGASETAPDRYVSFLDIDFEGNVATVLAHLRRYIDDPEKGNAFWDRFKERLARCETGGAGVADKLLLLHSHVYYMVDLFEEHDDEAALADLKKLEEECF
jgi:N(2)-fixation sustaining protein CowN